MTRQPDVYVVVLDTVRAAAGPTGPQSASTMPWLSSWAVSEATVYPRAMSVAPWTLPSHASLFTGAFPSVHGANELRHRFEPPMPTMAEWLKQRGYRTGAVSANAWVSPDIGFARGFDEFVRVWQLTRHDTDLAPLMKESQHLSRPQKALKVLRSGKPTDIANATFHHLRKRLRHGDFNAGKVNRKALELVAGGGSDPVFLFVNYMEAHQPYWPPRRYRRQFLPAGVTSRAARRTNQSPWRLAGGAVQMTDRDFEVLRGLYAAEVRYLDLRLRQLVEGIAERRGLDNAILVVLSDHGENIGDHGLLGHAYSLWETLLHVPLVVRFPGGEQAGTSDPRLAQTVDVLPTIAALLGDDGVRTQGRSLRAATPRDTAVAEYLGPMPTLDTLRHKYPNADIDRYDRWLRALRTADDDKLIWDSKGAHHLYALGEDPDERRNLVAEQPERAAELGRALDDWVKREAGELVRPEAEGVQDEVRRQLESLGYLG